MSDKKQKVTQGEASPLKGNNASVNVPQDALGHQGKVIHIGQTQTGGGVANTTKGSGN